MIIELLRWWYGPGWILAFKRINTRTANVAHAFSAGTLLKTLFAPWKRIQYTGKSFDAKMHAMMDNLVSRTVGFVVRLFVLIAALVMIAGSVLLSTAIVVAWPLVPLLIIFSLFRGIAG
ncbi:MAG TPA: hypothetical protein VK674_07055 [Candidatus Limnocylindria bacterium]|nr:hypothetical protein [Candidatus Limnocylindria bacterium]